MSKALFDARRQIAQVSTLLRQNNVVNAVQTLYGGVQVMVTQSLLKSEKDEFSNLISESVKNIAVNEIIRSRFAMQIVYNPGEEKRLMEQLRILLDSLEASAVSEAEKAFQERERKKREKFQKGATELGEGRVEVGKGIFESLASEYPTDVSLLVDMAEVYEKAGLLREAADLLEKALEHDQRSAYIHNKLGILYRKTKAYEKSDEHFKAAILLVPDDPYIYFNAGRLYVDSERWADAHAAAVRALECDPGFAEAQKLADYAKKRIK